MTPIRLPASEKGLAQAAALLEEQLADCPPKVSMAFQMALEETYINIVHYSGAQQIELALERDDASILLRLTDRGRPFDPLAHEDPDVTLGVDERPIGGLGIYMVKRLMDDVSYARVDGANVLTMRKALP